MMVWEQHIYGFIFTAYLFISLCLPKWVNILTLKINLEMDMNIK